MQAQEADLKTGSVFFNIKNNTGFMTLNRPEALNALNLEMIEKISAQLTAWEKNKQIKQMIVSSSNNRAFCAGGDLKAIYQIYLQHQKNPQKIKRLVLAYFKKEYDLNKQIKHYAKPYIALINGIAMGGGLGISLHGTLRIALSNLVLAVPETGIGYFADAGASYFLSRCEGQLGIYIALTGVQLNAAEAHYAKLVDHILGESPPENHLKKNLEIINSCFNYNTIDQILAALLKNNSDFARATHQILLQRSPLSLKCTLDLIRKSRVCNFDECMQNEYSLAEYFVMQPDFYEGIRAAVIDKDRKPKWSLG